MSGDFPIEYRGVPVPKRFLAPILIGGPILDAFKSGVDGALLLAVQNSAPVPEEVSEPGWSYFCDEVDPSIPDAYFRRIKGDDANTSQFMPSYGHDWDSVSEGRSWIERHYRPIRPEDLPESVARASGLLPAVRYFTRNGCGVVWRMPTTGRGEFQARGSNWEGSGFVLTDFFVNGDITSGLSPDYQDITGALPRWVRD